MLPIILPQKILYKSCLEHKTQVNATCDSSGHFALRHRCFPNWHAI